MKQREIKFRAWSPSLKEMITNFNCYNNLVKEGEIKFTINNYRLKQQSDYKLIPMKYTGLKDKDGKGKEIYHKDLIINKSRNGGKTHLIDWSDKLGAWVGSYIGLEYLIAKELDEIEVVGNKYENKKLLKSN